MESESPWSIYTPLTRRSANDWANGNLQIQQLPEPNQRSVGVFATKYIPAGEIILESYVIAVVWRSENTREAAARMAELHKNDIMFFGFLDRLWPRIRTPLEHLPRGEQITLIALKIKCNQFKPATGVARVASRLLTNSGSFFNHSCAPNAAHFQTDIALVKFVTIRPVLPGEQIYISYDTVSPIDSRIIRAERLQGLISRLHDIPCCACDCCTAAIAPSSKPSVFEVHSCWWCGEKILEDSDAVSCDHCSFAMYCNRVCHAANFKQHQEICIRLSETEPLEFISARFLRPGPEGPALWLKFDWEKNKLNQTDAVLTETTDSLV